jgi:hypothetical protein
LSALYSVLTGIITDATAALADSLRPSPDRFPLPSFFLFYPSIARPDASFGALDERVSYMMLFL